MTYKLAYPFFWNWTSPQWVTGSRRFDTSGLETSGTNYPARRRHIPKERIPPPPRCEHLKTRTFNLKRCFTLAYVWFTDSTTMDRLQRAECGRGFTIFITVAIHDNEIRALDTTAFY